MSVGTVQRQFRHSCMTNAAGAITPREPLLPTFESFGKTGETDFFQVLSPPLSDVSNVCLSGPRGVEAKRRLELCPWFQAQAGTVRNSI